MLFWFVAKQTIKTQRLHRTQWTKKTFAFLIYEEFPVQLRKELISFDGSLNLTSTHFSDVLFVHFLHWNSNFRRLNWNFRGTKWKKCKFPFKCATFIFSVYILSWACILNGFPYSASLAQPFSRIQLFLVCVVVTQSKQAH